MTREEFMTKAVRSNDGPIFSAVEEGKTYMWCACGKSANQPFCDGSHGGTSFSPVIYKAIATRQMPFCGCKKTQGAPMCDGSHSK